MKQWGAVALCAVLASGQALGHFEGRLQPCDNRPPDSALKSVTVPVAVVSAPTQQMFAECRKQPASLIIYGCAFQASGNWPAIIVLNSDQTPEERACTLAYEKAHLPPNNWFDPAMEALTPDAGPRVQNASVVQASR